METIPAKKYSRGEATDGKNVDVAASFATRLPI